MLAGVKNRFRLGARRAGQSAMGAVFLFLALVTFGAAGWIALADWQSPLIATLAVAGGFLVLALIFFAMAAATGRRADRLAAHPPPSRTVPPEVPVLVEAFMSGVVAGLRAGSAGRRR